MFNEQEKLAIKQTMQTVGWKYVLEVFNEEILEGKKPINFNTDGKSNEVIARDVVAREMASKIIDKVFKKLNGIMKEEKVKPIVYK